MANVKTGWLEDNTGEKFAPKTYPSQVIMRDGKTLEDSDIAYIDETDSDFIDDIEKDASDTILVPIEASGFTLNEATGRYEQTITVAGMTAVSGGIWDIVRSGSVLTEEEAEIVANITDVERLENGVKISCIEAPAQTYTLVLYGTFVNSGETLVSSMPAWFNRVEAVENKVGSSDISGIGDGTVTGAIRDINSSMKEINDASILAHCNWIPITPYSGANHSDGSSYAKIGTKVLLNLSVGSLNTSGVNTVFEMPAGYRPMRKIETVMSDGTANGTSCPVSIGKYGSITAYTKTGYCIGYIEYEAFL